MKLIPWRRRETAVLQPLNEIEILQDEMNKLFDFSISRAFGNNSSKDTLFQSNWGPAVDVYESDDDFLVKADLPGMEKNDIDISVHDGILTIKGEKKLEKEYKDKSYIRAERYYGSFTRSIEIPSEVDAEKVKASYKNGVLELLIPKKEEAKPKQIKIEVS